MEEALFNVQKNGKVGFINKAGQVVIDFEFDGASLFSEGIARVFYKDRVGCIDTKGNLVIPIVRPTSDSADAFENGLASVYLGKHFGKTLSGYINKTGDYVWEPSR